MIDERLAERLSLCLDGPDSLRCKRAQFQYAVAKGEILLSEDYPVLFDGYNVYGVSDDEFGQPGLVESHAYMNRPDVIEAFHVQVRPVPPTQTGSPTYRIAVGGAPAGRRISPFQSSPSRA